jgi:hypothetical protein
MKKYLQILLLSGCGLLFIFFHKSNSYNISIYQSEEINQAENKKFIEILAETFKEYFDNSSAIILLKFGLINSESFLEKYGEEAWFEVKNKIDIRYSTHVDREKLINILEHIIMSIDDLPLSFANDVKSGKIITKQVNKLGNGVVEIFEIDYYERNWNFIQKFCYRRELQLNGFTFWFRVKLFKLKERLLLLI